MHKAVCKELGVKPSVKKKIIIINETRSGIVHSPKGVTGTPWDNCSTVPGNTEERKA